MKYYRTTREARAALCADVGFDPFLSGGWGRATKAKLAEAGYPVDPARAEPVEDSLDYGECYVPPDIAALPRWEVQ